MPLKRVRSINYTPCTKTPEIPPKIALTVHTHSVVTFHCLYLRKRVLFRLFKMPFSNFTLQCPVCPHITLTTAFKRLGSINLPLTPKMFTEWLYGVSTASTIFRAYLILEKYQRFLTLLHTLSVFYIAIPRKEMFLFW